MASLIIDFQEGFSNDTVVVNVEGSEIFHKNDINTDYSLGRADSIEIQDIEGIVKVGVTVSTRNISGSTEIEVSKPIYLGVSIKSGRISFSISDEMFQYFWIIVDKVNRD